MNIVIVNNSVIPAFKYGGTERVIWCLGKELVKKGHRVTFLVAPGSYCDFAAVLPLDTTIDINSQIPADTDIVHFNYRPAGEIRFPYVVTMHGNVNDTNYKFDANTIFVSASHAARYNSASYVHNGLDWDEMPRPQLNNQRKYFHFLGKAAWRVKNVQGAIDVIKATPAEKLKVLGGTRLNIKMGFRFTATPRVSFYGMVGGEEKLNLLQGSKGLIFPVKWHEPFGLALTESLYFGCPIFGTPYGSLPEIVTPDVGYLSASVSQLAQAVLNADAFDRQKCHQYAVDVFNSAKMAQRYIEKYELVLQGNPLNKVQPQLIQPAKKFLPWQR